MKKDCRDNWLEIPDAFNKLMALLEMAYDEEEKAKTDKEWEAAMTKRENIPITIGFGDYVLVLPTCAQTVNGLQDFAENLVF